MLNLNQPHSFVLNIDLINEIVFAKTIKKFLEIRLIKQIEKSKEYNL